MPDPRFFEDQGPVALSELAALTGANLADAGVADRTVNAAASLAGAGSGDIAFLADPRQLDALRASRAGACFLPAGFADRIPASCVALVTASPQRAFALAADRLHRRRVSPSAPAISRDAQLESDVVLAPGVAIGPGVQIGRGTSIGPNTVIGPGVAIGRDCRISANVTIGFALIGDRVQIMAGAVIGEAGFGATLGPHGLMDIPQLGRVILQDGVTVGANSCIDRGALDDTVIGENTKIDNLVQIAHNVRVGRNCVMAAHTGVSGSVAIGDGARFGGRAGVVDHVTIGAGASIGAAAGVMKDVPAGETWGGVPAQPMRSWMRESAWLRRMSRRKEGRQDEP